MDGLTAGRIVHYTLNLNDVETINRRRVPGGGHGESWPAGAQAHVGNSVWDGDEFPMIVVRVFGDEGLVSGQVFLDGNDTYWATSRKYDPEKSGGTWHWPERNG